MRILRAVKDTHGIPVITDVHSPEEAAAAAQVADIIQLPAFLARQTDLVRAMAETGAVINIKKPQFLSPEQMRNIVDKFRECGNEHTTNTATAAHLRTRHQHRHANRRFQCGYDNLVVDMLGLSPPYDGDAQASSTANPPSQLMAQTTLQRDSSAFDKMRRTTADLRRDPCPSVPRSRRCRLRRSSLSGCGSGQVGNGRRSGRVVSGSPPRPEPGPLRWHPSALPLDQLEPFLSQVKAIDDLVKSQPMININ